MRFKLFTFVSLLESVLLTACQPQTAEVEVTREIVTARQVEVTPVVETTGIDTQEVQMESLKLPAVDPLAASGDIVIAGSSTVFPLAERMAERFQDKVYAGNITIDSIGSGRGLSASA